MPASWRYGQSGNGHASRLKTPPLRPDRHFALLLVFSHADGSITKATKDTKGQKEYSTVGYPVRKDGGTSIQFLPLDGSAPRLAASADINFDGRVSPDGSKIDVMRRRVDPDVVLLRDGASRER